MEMNLWYQLEEALRGPHGGSRSEILRKHFILSKT